MICSRYSVLQTNETLLDPSGHRIGLIGHLLKNVSCHTAICSMKSILRTIFLSIALSNSFHCCGNYLAYWHSRILAPKYVFTNFLSDSGTSIIGQCGGCDLLIPENGNIFDKLVIMNKSTNPCQ